MLIIAQAAKRDKLDDVPLSLTLHIPPQAISCGILIETILWHAAFSLAGGLHAGQLVGLLVYIILRFLNDFKTLTNALWILDKYPPPPPFQIPTRLQPSSAEAASSEMPKQSG